jgi:ribosomal-protein-alanine N-acetyltransferase
MKPPEDAVRGPESLQVREAVASDWEAISRLVFLEANVHRHLDWRGPLDWIGARPYWLLEEGRQIRGALACPPDPVSIAWIRLFAFDSRLDGSEAWKLLWAQALEQLRAQRPVLAAAITTRQWFAPILRESGFVPEDRIVVLAWQGKAGQPASLAAGQTLRAMRTEDLPAVEEVDAAAFGPLWRNSLPALTRALGQATYASVIEEDSGIVGYQLSTAGHLGVHLARLAVTPEFQRRGVATALVQDLKARTAADPDALLTVNTQSDNEASLDLYRRAGFHRTGEEYPVYTQHIA